MTIDINKLTLNGFYLDPSSSSIGGTRNIYSNGIMQGLIFLSWKYSAAEGDETTVAEVNDYLWQNRQFRDAGDNHVDYGSLEEKGWTIAQQDSWSYAHDTQVIVPSPDENTSNLPENKIWHLPVYLCPPKSSNGLTNIYYCLNDDNGNPILTTINAAFLTIEYHVWKFNSSDVEWFFPDGYVGTFRLSSIVSETGQARNKELHKLLYWKYDGVVSNIKATPVMDKMDQGDYLFGLDVNDGNSAFYIINTRYRYEDPSTIALIDKDYSYDLGSNYYNPVSAAYVNINGYHPIESVQCQAFGVKSTQDADPAGVWICRWSTYLEAHANDNGYEAKKSLDREATKFKAAVVDSFGNDITLVFSIEDTKLYNLKYLDAIIYNENDYPKVS